MTYFLFAATVLIWGTSWIAIALQIGDVPVVVSVFYRFATAGVIFILALVLLKKLVIPRRGHWPWILLQAVCLFSLNFICFYLSAAYITSGLIAVIFSLSVLFNAINARIFFRERITPKTIFACVVGLTGLICLFGPDIFKSENADNLLGIGFASLGTLFFSFGNMVSRHLNTKEVSPITANAWGMCLGAIILMIIIQVAQYPIVIPAAPTYWLAMFYLAIVGSVLGFSAYLLLLSRVGSAQAAYVTILFPIVALTISTFVEGYQWTFNAVLGIGLAITGNIIMFTKTSKPPLPATEPAK
ncbi:DMT family transporter [Terasakiella sp. A23]|uniref:DMT family transporter n=1 Tax=Terasakiella sp. FCG-A23 TaxID=3080561 RepID=UPI002952E0A8|nr:DMT family transporter [Terasakiella sp. A23]MDV7338910.1 DMT family transporter [Terasakiella sp. A23]